MEEDNSLQAWDRRFYIPIDYPPLRLFDICLNYIVSNIDCITKPSPRGPRLLEYNYLPPKICEEFLRAYNQKYVIDDTITSIFRNRQFTVLNVLTLHRTKITNKGFRVLMRLKPKVVDLSHCFNLTPGIMHIIEKNGANLVELKFGPGIFFVPRGKEIADIHPLNLPELTSLTMRYYDLDITKFLLYFPIHQLIHLDLTGCSQTTNLWSLHFKSLQFLLIHDVQWTIETLPWLARHDNLLKLDISNHPQNTNKQENPTQVLKTIVKSMPDLVYLDISGTNLAGSGPIPDLTYEQICDPSCQAPHQFCGIPGLVDRIERPLQYLGLFANEFEPYKRDNIPAMYFGGNASEKQLLVALIVNFNRPEMLAVIFTAIANFYKDNIYRYINKRVFWRVLEGMNTHREHKNLQICGCTALFHLAGRRNLRFSLKRQIVWTVINCADRYFMDNEGMAAALKAIYFYDFSKDLIFDVSRIIEIFTRSECLRLDRSVKDEITFILMIFYRDGWL